MLTSKQRAKLRALANPLDTIFQIGKNEMNDNFYQLVDATLEKRELIKLRVLETAPYMAREAAEIVAEACGADVVQVIGTRFVLYRPAEKPQIDLGK